MLNRRSILKHGALAASAIGLGGNLSAQPTSRKMRATNGLISAKLDADGMLSMATDRGVFAIGRFLSPGQMVVKNHKLNGKSPFGPGRVMEISPGENRILIADKVPLVFIRRDPRTGNANLPEKSVSVWSGHLNLSGDAGKMRVLGAGGLFDPANNPGQHVVTAIANPVSRAGMVAGLVRIDATSGVTFTAVHDGKIVLNLQNQYGSAIPPELDEFGGDWWAIGYFDDVRNGLETYADEFARINGVKLKQEPVGYCTWSSEKHGGASDQKYLIELADFEAQEFKPFGFNFVQIDDGWQGGGGGVGVNHKYWRANPHGPYRKGMKATADKIKALGLVPGLWLLPFGTYRDPDKAALLPLVVRDKHGKPYNAKWGGIPLDLTNPRTLDYVHSFITRAVHEWGFSHLKLDGMYTGLATRQTYAHMSYVKDDYGDAVFMNKHISNIQAARMGLKTVRQAMIHLFLVAARRRISGLWA